MCGRYGLAKKKEDLKKRFNLSKMPEKLNIRYNICPTDLVPVILNTSPDELRNVRWGLIPSWSKETSPKLLINAKAETICEKPTFKDLVKSKRCLILADAFYEWQKTTAGKVPYRFTLKTDETFAFAGLWDIWKNGEQEVVSCVIITTQANSLVAPVHDRMPVMLTPAEGEAWLKNGDCTLLKPFDEKAMKAQSISTLINSSKNDSIEVIQPSCESDQNSL